MLLYHMVPVAQWQECVASKQPYFPPTYQQDGFIHLTAEPSLLLTVANHFYTASQGAWEVLVLDSGKLQAEVKFEPAAPVGDKSSGGLLSGSTQQPQQAQQGEQQQAAAVAVAEAAPAETLFPHLYGTIDYEAVVEKLPMERDAEGRFLGIHGVAPSDCPFSDFT